MSAGRAKNGVLATLLFGLVGCAVPGHRGATPGPVTDGEAAKEAPMSPLAMTPQQFISTAKGTYVVVDLDSNRLRVMDGADTLWDAAVGTGTGLRLKGDDGEWHFTTPRGVFQIQYKEEMPIWYLPDWYFVEKKLPVPDKDAPERKLPGQLGVAAVYLGSEIAIHGTERPELLGQRVSHGCIRLANENVLRLYHNVQIGTPVVIVGGEKLDDTPPPPTPAPSPPKPKKPDPLAAVPTTELLKRLDAQLAAEKRTPEWVAVVSRLMTRGLKDDAPALRGLLERAGTGSSPRVNHEYGTFLADAFSRGTLRAVVSLARIAPAARERAARAIVAATLSLYPGGVADARAPWPTGRVPAEGLGPEGRAGWQALAAAEKEYRASNGSMASAAVSR